ncbi:MAG: hypothetical protein MZV65_00630 [Chromatiales bacterium]|nr:hypothetical protein [Chromatiales bacterium]
MAEHDNSYKLLFFHAEMVTDLLRGSFTRIGCSNWTLPVLKKLAEALLRMSCVTAKTTSSGGAQGSE